MHMIWIKTGAQCVYSESRNGKLSSFLSFFFDYLLDSREKQESHGERQRVRKRENERGGGMTCSKEPQGCSGKHSLTAAHTLQTCNKYTVGNCASHYQMGVRCCCGYVSFAWQSLHTLNFIVAWLCREKKLSALWMWHVWNQNYTKRSYCAV